ncbi:hypothetical protein [Phycicoccus sp. Root101]|uniref:hypothetical protein n=1 Tax=Phycicoccus sp. Root101 TaxID=1736421 RepID=UPI000703052F|nr:hypothetical protein [Phycicoccus sp. Root101]KQU68211.1 hypothetical protein ASC58_11645 [Phycicoccus sp. Root101]
MTAALAWAMVSCTALSVLVVGGTLPLLRRHSIVDIPADRSLHVVPTPRGGGLGVVAAVLGAVVLVTLLRPDAVEGHVDELFLVLLPVLGFGLVGFADDLWSLSVRLRLVVQAVLALVWSLSAMGVTGDGVVWVPFVLVGTIAMVNITNFMDGVNGLVSGHAVVAGLWYAVAGVHYDVPAVAVLGIGAAAGGLGFLPFNLPRAKVFLGDIGSYALGATWAVVASWLVMLPVPTEVALAPLFVLVLDAGVTLVRRMSHGDRVFEPHRLHVYQRVARAGWSHATVAGIVAAATAVACLLALPAMLGASRPTRGLVLVADVLLGLAYLALPGLVGGSARWGAARGAVDLDVRAVDDLLPPPPADPVP